MCSDHMPYFVYATLTGDSVELIPNGANTHVKYVHLSHISCFITVVPPSYVTTPSARLQVVT